MNYCNRFHPNRTGTDHGDFFLYVQHLQMNAESMEDGITRVLLLFACCGNF